MLTKHRCQPDPAPQEKKPSEGLILEQNRLHTNLIGAILKNNITKVGKILVSNDFNLNIVHPKHDATALMYACQVGNQVIIELLLQKGADPTVQNKQKRTAKSYCKGAENKVIFDETVKKLCPAKTKSA